MCALFSSLILALLSSLLTLPVQLVHMRGPSTQIVSFWIHTAGVDPSHQTTFIQNKKQSISDHSRRSHFYSFVCACRLAGVPPKQNGWWKDNKIAANHLTPEQNGDPTPGLSRPGLLPGWRPAPVGGNQQTMMSMMSEFQQQQQQQQCRT